MRSQNAKVAVLLYTLLTGLALALGFFFGRPDLYHHPDPLISMPFWLGLPVGVGAGIGFGQAVVWLSQKAVTSWKFDPSIRLHVGLRQILGVADAPLREIDVIVLAISSAIGEELLFRGWLQPFAGLVISSLAFGLLHFAPRSKGMWVWMPMALAMGFALGGMFLVTGNLAAPMAAHCFINYRNLHFINNYDPELVKPLSAAAE